MVAFSQTSLTKERSSIQRLMPLMERLEDLSISSLFLLVELSIILNIVTVYLYLILKNRGLPCCTKLNISGIRSYQSLIYWHLGGRFLGNPGYSKQKPEYYAFFASSSFPTHIPTEKKILKKATTF